MSWGDDLAGWWLDEVSGDPAYREEIVPLALELIEPKAGDLLLDLGCGEGRMMEAVADRGARPIGCDVSRDLSRRAAARGPAVVGRLPDLGWLRDGSVDGGFAVLALEHLGDLGRVMTETARVVRPGGRLAVVANHPVFTAVGSAPVLDPADGETLWRWGDYFGEGSTTEPAGSGRVVFHHRSMQDWLNAAATAGWSLQRLVERPAGRRQVERDPLLAGQESIPRLLGAAWLRR